MRGGRIAHAIINKRNNTIRVNSVIKREDKRAVVIDVCGPVKVCILLEGRVVTEDSFCLRRKDLEFVMRKRITHQKVTDPLR